MCEQADIEKYRVENQQPVQGQVIGDYNTVHFFISGSSPSSAAVPALETSYLTSLIEGLEANKGVLEYVELSTQTTKPAPSDEWAPGFALLVKGNAQLRESQHVTFENIHQLVEEYPRFVLIGKPGAGKTTMLRRLALESARKRLDDPHRSRFPLLLYLPTWNESESMPTEFVRNRWPIASDPTGLLTSGDALLLLDGLNEMGAAGEEKVKKLRHWLHSGSGPKRVIIACRQADYSESWDLKLPTVQIQDMDELDIRQFATKYLSDKAEPFLKRILPVGKQQSGNAYHLFQLVSNPYLLAALIFVYVHSPDGDMPRNSGALFQRMVMALWERERIRQTPGWLPFEEMETALSELAFAMIDENKPIDVPIDYALKYLNDKKLVEVGCSANIIEVHSGKIRFYHQLLQEYFAAAAVVPDPSRLTRKMKQDLVYGRAYRMWGERSSTKWDEVAIALCGIMNTPDLVLRFLCAEIPGLASDCIRNLDNQISVSLRHQLIELLLAGLPKILDKTINAQLVWRLLEAFKDLQYGAAYGEFVDKVITALVLIGKLATEVLVKSLNGDLWTRVGAARVLGQMRDPRAVPGLIKLLEDEDYVYFERNDFGLADDDPVYVRYIAEKALMRIDTPEARVGIQQWQSKQSPSH